MEKHKVKQNGIFYIIPNDDLYDLFRKGEAYIDKYGRLINSKNKRVLKELEQIADDRPIYVLPPKEEHPIRDSIVESATDAITDIIKDGANRCAEVFLYDVIPHLWHYKVKPGIKRLYHSGIYSKKTKADTILKKRQAIKRASTTQLVKKSGADKQKKVTMTEEEIIIEQKKAILHYIGLLDSLTKLHNAGVIDKNKVLEQLTNPATIESFNQMLSANPNLLEMTQHIEITTLLGRDLFQNGNYVPISADEIKLLAIK